MSFGPAPLPSLGLLYDPTVYEPGLFSINRSDSHAGVAQLAYGHKLTGEYGAYTLTGQDATLAKDTPTALAAAPLPMLSFLTLGSSGTTVMYAEPGSYALNGQAATLRTGLGLTGEPGVWTISVAPAERDIELTAAVRLFQVLGQDATLTWGRGMTVEHGLYAMTGQEAGYVFVSGSDKTMSGDPGRWYMNQIDTLPPGSGFENATLIYSRNLQCDPGVFTLTWQSATMSGPRWHDVAPTSGAWVYVTPSGGVWTDVDPDF